MRKVTGVVPRSTASARAGSGRWPVIVTRAARTVSVCGAYARRPNAIEAKWRIRSRLEKCRKIRTSKRPSSSDRVRCHGEPGTHERPVGDRDQQRPRLEGARARRRHPRAPRVMRDGRYRNAATMARQSPPRSPSIRRGRLPEDRRVEAHGRGLVEHVADPSRPRRCARVAPARSTAAASSRSRGTPSIRGMFMIEPSGSIPSAVSVPSSSRPTRPIVPSPPAPTTTSYPSRTAPRVSSHRLLLGLGGDQLVAQVVARHQVAQRLLGGAVRGQAGLAPGARVPEHPDAPGRRGRLRSSGRSAGTSGAGRQHERREVAAAQEVGRGHVRGPVVSQVDAAGAHAGDERRQGGDHRARQARSGRISRSARTASQP